MLRQLGAFLSTLFAERLDRSQISDVPGLTRFVRTRAAYVAQTSLYGYLKTRMGTSFERHFQDDVYVAAMRAAAIRLFASCLADLTVFAVATAAVGGRLTDMEAQELAYRCFREALAEGVTEPQWTADAAAASERFSGRLRRTAWAEVATGEAAFVGSAGDLIRLAPIVDEFKALDREIVTNSIRFRWRDIREQFRRRVDGTAIAVDWRRAEAGRPC
jgi:hypothetical protein